MRPSSSRFNLLTPFHPSALRNTTNKVPSPSGGGLGWGLTTLALAMFLVLLPATASGQIYVSFDGQTARGWANERIFDGSAHYVGVHSIEHTSTSVGQSISVSLNTSFSLAGPSVGSNISYGMNWSTSTQHHDGLLFNEGAIQLAEVLGKGRHGNNFYDATLENRATINIAQVKAYGNLLNVGNAKIETVGIGNDGYLSNRDTATIMSAFVNEGGHLVNRDTATIGSVTVNNRGRRVVQFRSYR